MVIENKEVTWNVLDIPVYGTITRPMDNEGRSTVVFVVGSGPLLTGTGAPLFCIEQTVVASCWLKHSLVRALLHYVMIRLPLDLMSRITCPNLSAKSASNSRRRTEKGC